MKKRFNEIKYLVCPNFDKYYSDNPGGYIKHNDDDVMSLYGSGDHYYCYRDVDGDRITFREENATEEKIQEFLAYWKAQGLPSLQGDNKIKKLTPKLVVIQKEVKKWTDDTTTYTSDTINFNGKEYSKDDWDAFYKRVQLVNKRFK